MTKILLLFAFVTLTVAFDTFPEKITDIKDCHCNDGFEAKGTPDVGYKCHGIFKKIIVLCNTIQRPRCICTDHTGVLTDETGTWCTRYGGGREIRRWNCENTEDWETFFTAHPDERPKPKV